MLGEGVGIVDENETFVFANHAASKIFQTNNLIGKNLFNFITDKSKKVIQEETNKRKSGEESIYDLDIVTELGECRNIIVTATPYTVADNTYIGTFGVFRDITEQKQAEQALKESEEKYKELFEANTDGISILRITPDGIPANIIEVNESTLKLTGYSKEEILKMTLKDIDVNYENESVPKRLKEIQTKGFTHFETILKHKDGHEIPAEVKVILINYKNQPAAMNILRDITDRKKAEQALQESEEKFKGIFEHANAGIAIASLEGTVTGANKGFEKLLGYSQAELRNMNFRHFTHPDCIGNENELLKKLFKREIDNFRIEKRYIHKTGRNIWVDLSVAAVKDEKGEFSHLIGMVKDVTEKKKAEQALKESEKEFRAIFEKNSSAMLIVNAETIILNTNETFFKVTGYTKDEIIGKSWTEIIPENDLHRLLDYNKKRLSNNKEVPDRYDFNFYNKKREIRHGLISISYSEKDRYIIASFIDITDRKQAEQALKESLSDLKLAQKIAIIGNWKYDPAIGVPEWSDLCYEIYERKPEEGPPNSDEYKKMFQSEHYEMSFNAFQNAVNNGVPFSIRLKLELKNNKVKWIQVICQPESEKQAKGYFLRGTTQDITEQKLAEEKIHKYSQQLEEANATKDRFISVLGHDLKNPFNTLLGFSELLSSKVDIYDKEKIKKFASTIHTTAKHSYNLLNSLLEWSRSQRDKIPFNPQPVNLYALAHETYLLLKATAEAKKIEIKLDIPQQLEIEADRDMVGTVIRNLLSNAVKFTRENGSIHVSVKETAQTVKIAIADNGTGMDETTKNALFKIGETTSKKGTSNEKGTGLGLLLCKEFTDKHNGSIHVESEPGEGSTFIVTLPVKQEMNN